MDAQLRTIRGSPVATIASFAAGPRAPLVHFAHATGMCAGLYRPVFERLTPYVNVIASDARGHGRTELPADPAALTTWDVFAADLGALLDSVAPPPRLILAGHSMGATVSMLVAAARNDVAAVVLIEPAIVPFAVAAQWNRHALPNPMAAQAARRRAVWPSRAAMRAAYHGRGVFATWSDTDLDAYLGDGVRDRADGQVELACAPAWEAATFAAVSTGLEAAVAEWQGGLALLHGTTRSTVMSADAATIAARAGTVVRRFDGADHFLPLAEPTAMADAILAFA